MEFKEFKEELFYLEARFSEILKEIENVASDPDLIQDDRTYSLLLKIEGKTSQAHLLLATLIGWIKRLEELAREEGELKNEKEEE